jgi:hypothetical protein
VDVANVLEQVEAARALVESGSLELVRPTI